jgi:3D (Asp-Asp-Asp) domain-containing protein
MKKILLALVAVVLIVSGVSEPAAIAKTKTKTVKVTSTAYCGGGKTATGYNLSKHKNAKVVAVDPHYIKLGSKVYVPGYGTAVARDTGGAIKGKKIDVHFKTRHQALKWGRKHVKIKVYRR